MADRRPCPPVDPLFDGHHERPFREWTPSERLDWIWATMQLLRDGERSGRAPAAPRSPDGRPPTG